MNIRSFFLRHLLNIFDSLIKFLCTVKTTTIKHNPISLQKGLIFIIKKKKCLVYMFSNTLYVYEFYMTLLTSSHYYLQIYVLYLLRVI